MCSERGWQLIRAQKVCESPSRLRSLDVLEPLIWRRAYRAYDSRVALYVD